MAKNDNETQAPDTTAKLSLPTLTTMVVGSMVGAGVLSLPRRFAQETDVAGALIARAVAGTGMLMLGAEHPAQPALPRSSSTLPPPRCS